MGSRGDVKGFSGIDIRVSARVVSFLTFSICARPLACVKLSTVFLNMACWAKREPSGIPLLYYFFLKKKGSAKLSPYGWGAKLTLPVRRPLARVDHAVVPIL